MGKKILLFSIAIIIAVGTFVKFYFFNHSLLYKDKSGIAYSAKVDDKYFYIYNNGKWEKQFIKGVNMGVGKPGAFPGEFAITKEDYLRWFKYIGDMNANSIRVYTILKPEFYEALYEYNNSAKKPIYLFQGVWVNEEDIAKIKDADNPKIKDAFKSDIKTIVDVIHGNIVLPKKPGYAGGSYDKDVSSYVVGWVLGIEWDPELVINTDNNNKDKKEFKGTYLYTKDSSPFEAFLCEAGDYAIDYETKTYKMQKPLSFTNWVTTDMLNHPNEPMKKEDMATVNTEHIKSTKDFKPGLFASYHIYPYYPDFMNYQKEYASFKDKDGKVNTYKAYLKDLIKEHTVPVLVAEFGIPAARGMAHVNIHTGFNQGNVDEKSQGEMDSSMLKNIYDEGYAGGLVFAWQDEWFKRTWNTMDFDMPERRPFWSNTQTNEQEFGLLAFDPGEQKSVCYVDGDISEWKEDKPISMSNNLKLYTKCDEKYLYFMVDAQNFDFDKDTILLPIDSIQNQGNATFNDYNINFKRPADFVIGINGKDNSRIMIDSYYDSFYYVYAKQLYMIEANSSYENKNNGIFNNEYLCLNRELFLPQDKIKLPLSKYENGKLTFGDGNPEHKEYNSLADFIVKDNKVEIRIPWQMLNVMDPSTKMIMGDLYNGGIKPIKTDGFYIGAVLMKNNNAYDTTDMNIFSWKEWEMPTYHERLKPSYYIMKDAFNSINLQK